MLNWNRDIIKTAALDFGSAKTKEVKRSQLDAMGFAEDAAGYGQYADVWYINGDPILATHYDNDGHLDGFSVHEDKRMQGIGKAWFEWMLNGLGFIAVVSPNDNMMRLMQSAGNVESSGAYDIYHVRPKKY